MATGPVIQFQSTSPRQQINGRSCSPFRFPHFRPAFTTVTTSRFPMHSIAPTAVLNHSSRLRCPADLGQPNPRSVSHKTMVVCGLLYLFVFLISTTEAQLKVRIVGNAAANSNPFISEAVRGCHEASVAAGGSTAIQCREAVIDGFISASAMQAQWDSLVTGNDDEVFIGLSFTYADVVSYLSPRYPNKVFAVVDSTVEPTAQKNTMGVVFAEDQAGYLAGALAGVFTATRKVGVIGGVPIPPVKRFVNGYLSGVLSLCPTCEVYHTYVPSFVNVTGGQLAADGLLANGADVVFGAGGLTGSSGILRAASQGAWAIGVDSDESRTTFLDKPEAPKLLASALKRSDTAVKTVIDSVRKGQRGGFNLALDASLDGVGLSELVSTTQRNFSTEVTVSLRGSSGDACATTTASPRSTILNLIRSSLQRRLLTTGVFAGSGDLQPLAAPANKTWYDMAPYGERFQVLPNMQGHGATVLANTNRILVWGGQNQFAQFPTQVMVLDFDRFSWQRMPTAGGASPTGRMFHAMGYDAQANAVWVFGGQTQIVNGDMASAVLGDTWKLDVSAKTWTQMSANTKPSARTNVAQTNLGRSMWMYGGTTAAGIVQSDLWKLDMAEGTWTLVTATGTLPPALQHASMAAINSTHLLLFGGAQASAVSNTLYVLDTTTLVWRIHKPSTLTSGGSGPPAAERMRAIAVDNRRVLFTGGLSEQGALNSTWVWRLDEDRWDPNGYGALPGQLHSHALVMFNQSQAPGACTFMVDATAMTICKAQTVNAVMAISGVTNRPNGGVAVSFANPDPPPPPMGIVDAGVKWAVTVINIVGILLALALVAFVIVNRTNKVVKAANPPFCLIILTGALLAHVGLIGSGWDMDARSGMMQTAFLLGGGYTLMFSGLVTKVFLVYSIFSSKKIMKRNMAPYYLFTFLAFGVQMLLSGLWFLLDSTPVVSVNIAGTVWIIRTMDTNWVVLTSIPVVLLTVGGLFFAFQTRNVSSAFNEAQYVAIATYAIALTLLVVGTVVLLLQQPLVQYIISAVLVSLTTTAVQIIFFLPKVQNVYMAGSGVEMTSAFIGGASSTGATSSTGDLTISQQQLRCKTCKQIILTSSQVATTSFVTKQQAGKAGASQVIRAGPSAIAQSASQGAILGEDKKRGNVPATSVTANMDRAFANTRRDQHD